MILIFAGAGASKAVDPDNYPTTIEFLEKLPKEIKEDPYFDLINKYFFYKNDKIIDIEKVLWVIDELYIGCRPLSSVLVN
ncbi:hypothetical protein KAU33_16530 [Candidatus Dependentiae bacterium]|nr:hypothetical protein [Candidatus Dependentiae bacterium]